MEQDSASKYYNHQIFDDKDVNGEGVDVELESLEDDFKSLLIGNEENSKHYRTVPVPSNAEHLNVELRSDEGETHSDFEFLLFEEQGWCQVTKSTDPSSAALHNNSLHINFVSGTDVPTKDTIKIKRKSEIIPSPAFDGNSSYRFKIKPTNESSKKVFKISLDSEHVKCSICLDIWHDVVTVAPCLHNFCNGCFSEWSITSQEVHTIVLCPHCSSDVQSVGRNRMLHRIETKIRKTDSFVRRSYEELAVVNSYPLIKPLPVKRLRLMREQDYNGIDIACTECGTEYGGFECDENMVHLQCHACGGLMPFITDIAVPQHCIGCDRPFCGAYWHSQQFSKSDSYPMCDPETFKPIGERTITSIPILTHERNRHEQNLTYRCIQQMGKTLQDVVSEWVTKLDNRLIDRTRMPLNHAAMITSATHICNGCFDKLVSFLLYWFRICLPKDHLPADAVQREDCWYGYACRTQHHSAYHARKRNHVCPPTKGSIGN